MHNAILSNLISRVASDVLVVKDDYRCIFLWVHWPQYWSSVHSVSRRQLNYRDQVDLCFDQEKHGVS